MGKQGRVRWRVQKQVEIAERRWRVSALYLSGRSQPEIGKLLGIDPSTVASDVYALTQEWKAQSMQNMDEAKAQELGRVNRLEREYWDAYERSRQVKQRRVASRTENPDGTQTATASRVEEERVEGDPRFLAGVQWCIDKR